MNIYEENRPWGSLRRFTENESTTVKILTVHAGEAFSLQTHEQRDEFWHVLSGNPTITIGDKQEEAHTGDEFLISRGTAHRIEAVDDQVTVLEISFGDFDENDITRLEDKYGRS